MTLFTPDFAAVDAGFPIYEKGMYQVKITAVTPEVYAREDDQGNKNVKARMRFKMEMFGRRDEDDELVSTDENGKEIRGKPVQALDVYLHTEGGWSFAKSPLMAFAGYAKDEENEADSNLFQAGDWSFSGDPEDSEEVLRENMGDAWSTLVDRFAEVYLRKETEIRDGRSFDSQAMSSWAPVDDAEQIDFS